MIICWRAFENLVAANKLAAFSSLCNLRKEKNEGSPYLTQSVHLKDVNDFDARGGRGRPVCSSYVF